MKEKVLKWLYKFIDGNGMNEKLLVLGAAKSKGVSKKTGKKYDFAKLFVARPAVGFGEDGSSCGLDVNEFTLTDKAYLYMQTLEISFPNMFSVSFGINSRKQCYVNELSIISV